MRIQEQFTVITTLTVAEMKGRYRNTFAGLLWVMFNPLILFSVHALIFKHVLRIDLDRYYTFLLSGLLPWIYISNTLTQTVHSFITMREPLLSFQIHPVSIIISKSIDSFINFIFPFGFLFILLSQIESFTYIGILLVPIAMFFIFVTTTALAIFLATLQVFFRDTQYLTHFTLSILFYRTPIFYPRHLIPVNYQFLVDINPFYALINIFKVCLWDYSFSAFMASVTMTSIFTVIIIVISILFWKKTRNELYINI